METLQLQLFEAAAKGNVSSLHHLLTVDPLLLERVTPNYYNSETALHVSALLGHLDFVKEIIRIKPELTNELNTQHSSPLHLASVKGHVKVVRELLSVVGHETMCLASDKDGLTPLHLAAIKGRVEVMKLLLQAKSEAARLTLNGGETILHLCVKNWQLEALNLLVSSVSDPEFVKCKDGEGNTLLHLAVEYKQVETINLLVNNGTGAAQVDVNAVNNKGLTAMDVLNRSRSDVRDSEISESLKRGAGAGARARARASILGDKRIDDKNWFTKHLQEIRNALMVVASVVSGFSSKNEIFAAILFLAAELAILWALVTYDALVRAWMPSKDYKNTMKPFMSSTFIVMVCLFVICMWAKYWNILGRRCRAASSAGDNNTSVV